MRLFAIMTSLGTNDANAKLKKEADGIVDEDEYYNSKLEKTPIIDLLIFTQEQNTRLK